MSSVLDSSREAFLASVERYAPGEKLRDLSKVLDDIVAWSEARWPELSRAAPGDQATVSYTLGESGPVLWAAYPRVGDGAKVVVLSGLTNVIAPEARAALVALLEAVAPGVEISATGKLQLPLAALGSERATELFKLLLTAALSVARAHSVSATVTHGFDPQDLARVLSVRVDDCGVQVRTLNCLKNADVRTLGLLAQRTPAQLMAIKNFGAGCLRDVAEVLTSWGINFDMRFAIAGRSVFIEQPGTRPTDVYPDIAAPTRRYVVAPQPAPPTLPEPLPAAPVLVRDCLPDAVQARFDALVETASASGPVPGWTTLTALMREPIDRATGSCRMDRQSITRHIEGLVTLYERLAAGERVSIVEELAVAIAFCKERDRLAATRYLGLDARPTATLEKVGVELGVTRERARQLVQRVMGQVHGISPPLPICSAIAEVLRQAGGPISLAEWQALIPEAVRPRSADELVVLRELERWGWLPNNSWHEHGVTFVVNAGDGKESELEQLSIAFVSALEGGAR
jgi:RNA polymerase alpha subunit